MKKLIIIIIMSIVTGCTANKEKENLTPIFITLDWTPNTHHTGLYVAVANKYYEKEGLDVHITQPGKSTASILVAQNKAEFGIASQGDYTFSCLDKMPLISLAALNQNDISGFYSLKTKNITIPKSFRGKTYGGWGSPVEEAEIKAVMRADGVENPKFKTVDIGSTDVRTSLSLVDFIWGFKGWQGEILSLSKLSYNFIPITEYNKRASDEYASLLFSNKNYVKNHDDIVRKFLKATTKGYEYSIDHPEQSARILLQFAPELNEDLVLKSQKYYTPFYKGNQTIFGEQDPRRFKNFTDWLYEEKVIHKNIDMTPFFTNRYLTVKK